jgi:hypothetical protein
MIFDFRMSIFDLSELPSRNSRFSCGYRDRCKLIRFLEDRVNACRIHKFGRNNHLKPRAGFIRFFLDHTCFVDEVRSGQSDLLLCFRCGSPARHLQASGFAAQTFWFVLSFHFHS